MAETVDLDQIKSREAKAQHALDQDPGMHPDDRPAIWAQAYGEEYLIEDVPLLRKELESLRAANTTRLGVDTGLRVSAPRNDGTHT